MTLRFVTLAALGAVLISTTVAANAPDAATGKQFFGEQCGVCHTAEANDNGGSQGPSLIGVFGRKAAGDSAFDYTKELRTSGLTWDAATLDRFLEAPDKTVPGTVMSIPVPDKALRGHLIAYLQSVKNN
jgi:cytochrome c2